MATIRLMVECAPEVSRSGVFIERAGLKLLDPDSDQVARNVVAFRETVERLARNEFLGDLPFEFDAMGRCLAMASIL